MTEDPKLSKRLKTIAAQINNPETFVDVGSDHAYLPCYICKYSPDTYAIAGEVQHGPYENAKKTVKKYGLEKQIKVRLGDGLSILKKQDQVNTVIIAGMGGQLITNILKNGETKLDSVNKLILQPNTDEHLVREYLYQSEFNLQNELIICDNMIIYEVLVAVKAGEDNYSSALTLEKQMLFGPILLQEKSALFIEKWGKQLVHLQSVLKQMKQAKKTDTNKMLQIENQILWIKEVLNL